MFIEPGKIVNIFFAFIFTPSIIGIILTTFVHFWYLRNQSIHSEMIKYLKIQNKIFQYSSLGLLSTLTVVFVFVVVVHEFKSELVNRDAPPYHQIDKRTLIDVNGKNLELIRDMPENIPEIYDEDDKPGLYFMLVVYKNKKNGQKIDVIWVRKYGEEAPALPMVAFGYDAMLVIQDAIENAEEINSQEINDALYDVNIVGAGGAIKINTKGLAERVEKVFQVKEGFPVLVD